MLYVAEPGVGYAPNPPLVVDCSVLAAALFAEPTRDEAVRRLAHRTLHAPTLIEHEIASVALKKHRQGWPAASITLALSGFDQQAIELHRIEITAQCELAQRFGLSAYDAAYLRLAQRLRAPLATFDRALAEAAQRVLGGLDG